MAYTSEEIARMEEQYEIITRTIKRLKADQRKLYEVLRQRKIYEQKVGYKVKDKVQYSKLSPEGKKEYNRLAQEKHRKKKKGSDVNE